MGNVVYNEISRAKVTDTREVVISDCSRGGFTMAQVMSVQEGDVITPIFMKGAFHIDSIEHLYNLRDAINIAIKKIEDGEVTETTDWD